MRAPILLTMILGLAAAGSGPAAAANCRDPSGFPAWLAQVKQEAIAKGISASAVESGLEGIQFDPGVIRKDHGQGVFRQSFEVFAHRMVDPRLARARAAQKKYADIFERIEAQYGVSSPVLLAIWGMETDNGAAHPNFKIIQSVATLAYDCRRSEMFKAELFDALRMVQKGAPPSMRGNWAGEIGQTQFMPSTYLKYAVGGKDLDHSAYDALASTANFLHAHGWRKGAGWAPGEPNFAAIQEWNKAPVYSRAIAYFATRLAGGSEASAKTIGSSLGDDAPAPRKRPTVEDDQGYAAPPPAADPNDDQPQ